MSDDAAEDLRSIAERWAELQHRLGERGSARRANRVFDELTARIESMRDTPAHDKALSELMHHADPYVQIVGARHLLGSSSEARAVLEHIERGDLGLASVTAEYVLKEYDAGRLR